jgi:Family of unknown function (DUF6151)
MSHPLLCRCGALQGHVENPRSANRALCYCKDCQAFAHFLGRQQEILDDRGGSDVIQILPRNVTFTQGVEFLACMRLTPKGMLRWYARCCRTPIGNTLETPKVSFVGLLHTCLEGSSGSLDVAFGPIRAWVNTKAAKGDPKPKVVGVGTTVWWFIGTTLKARLNGDYTRTPFFHANTGTPVVPPQVLTGEEHAKLMDAVRGATG